MYTSCPLVSCEHNRAFFLTLVVTLLANISCCGDIASSHALTNATYCECTRNGSPDHNINNINKALYSTRVDQVVTTIFQTRGKVVSFVPKIFEHFVA